MIGFATSYDADGGHDVETAMLMMLRMLMLMTTTTVLVIQDYDESIRHVSPKHIQDGLRSWP